ncbi:MAG: hypothetical protein V3U87_16030 [Methylococcaceae bacterium]
MAVISIIYIVVIADELLEDGLEELLEDPHELAEITLFVITAILYALFAIWMSRTTSKVPIVITIIGTLGLIVLYGIAISDLAEPILGMSPEDIESEATLSKIFQITLVVILFVRLKLK